MPMRIVAGWRSAIWPLFAKAGYEMGVIPRSLGRQARLSAAAVIVGTALTGCGALLLPGISQAALGASMESIAADQAGLHASINVSVHPGYEIHELTLPSGTSVREYVTGAGIVFAVTWNGAALPDLRQILGSSFADYLGAAQSRHGGHHHLSLARSDLSIVSSGHMRAFTGRAVLLPLVPAGVSGNELR